MRLIVELLSTRFRQDSVNLLIAHTHLEGAILAGSERVLGDEWAATPQALPSIAHYIALGHIYQPQQIVAAASPTYYAGSPLQLDFGEAGEEKSFVVIRAEPGRPARIERVPYRGGLPLREVRKTLEDLDREAEALRASGWLRVTVPLEVPDIELNSKVRRLLGSAAVSVDYELPARAEPPAEVDRRGLHPPELFVFIIARTMAATQKLGSSTHLMPRCAKPRKSRSEAAQAAP
jgi:exonuclease SbcD